MYKRPNSVLCKELIETPWKKDNFFFLKQLNGILGQDTGMAMFDSVVSEK